MLAIVKFDSSASFKIMPRLENFSGYGLDRSIYFQEAEDIVKLFSGNKGTPKYIVEIKGTLLSIIISSTMNRT